MRRKPHSIRATIVRLTYLADEGVLSRSAWEYACFIAGHVPTVEDWWRFIQRTLLIVGGVFVIAGLMFWGAYNPVEPPLWLQFGGLQAGIIIAFLGVYLFGLESLPGKMALFVSAMLVGALLAVIGQEYQTGADSYEVFLVWALLITGWVVYSQWGFFWLVWLVLLNIGIVTFWYQTIPWSPELQIILSICINAFALGLWEWGNLREISWLSARWIPRLVAFVTMSMASVYMAVFLLEGEPFSALIIYVALLLIFVIEYYFIIRDLFMLMLCSLSIVLLTGVAIVAFGANLDDIDAGSIMTLLCIGGMAVMAETAFLVNLLLQIQAGWDRESEAEA